MTTHRRRSRALAGAVQPRRYAVDAAIVRCMKARKRLRYTEVVEQVTKMLVARFVPQPSLLKKRLEDLISRE